MSDDKMVEREMLLLETIENDHHHHHHSPLSLSPPSHQPHYLKTIPNGKRSNGGVVGGHGACGGGKDATNEHFTQDLVRHINLHNFKILALLLVVVFIFYHGYLNSFYGLLLLFFVV